MGGRGGGARRRMRARRPRGDRVVLRDINRRHRQSGLLLVWPVGLMEDKSLGEEGGISAFGC